MNLFERLEKGRLPTAEKAIEQPHREDPIASTILRALRQKRPNGLNRRAIIFLFHRNHKAAKLDTALDKLWREGKVRRDQQGTTPRGGRPSEVWFATQHD